MPLDLRSKDLNLLQVKRRSSSDMEKKFQEKREVRVMKEVKKPSVVPVQVRNEGGPPRTPMSEQTIFFYSYGYLQFQFKPMAHIHIHPSQLRCCRLRGSSAPLAYPFFEHFLGGGRLKSRFYPPDPTRVADPMPIFQVTLQHLLLSSTSYQYLSIR